MEIALLLARILLAGIFALAGIAKFIDLRGSEKAFKDFGVPSPLAMPGAVALSLAEIGIAVLLLSTTTSWYAAIAALSLLLLFIVQIIYQLAKGNTPDCHCFGQIHSEPVSKVSIIRNIAFACAAGMLVYSGQNLQGMAFSDSRLDVMQLIFGLSIVTLLLAVIFYLRKIIGRQGEILRRIELVELVARDGSVVERDEAGHPHEGLPIGALFPDFSLPDIAGEVVSLDDLRAAKLPILFLFVSPTCNPCKALVPEIEDWQANLDGKVKIVFLSNGSAEDNVEKLGGGTEKVILLQDQREIAEMVQAKWTPTAVLVDSTGRIASHAAAGDTAIRQLVAQIHDSDLTAPLTYFSNDHGHSHTNSKLGSSIPEFLIKDINGRAIDASYFRGKKSLVTFWSQTCPHCLAMADELRDWEGVRGADDPSLVVFSDGKIEDLEALGLASPVILDESHKIASGFGMFGTPSAVLVNEDGVIISETAVGAPNIWSLIGKRK